MAKKKVNDGGLATTPPDESISGLKRRLCELGNHSCGLQWERDRQCQKIVDLEHQVEDLQEKLDHIRAILIPPKE